MTAQQLEVFWALKNSLEAATDIGLLDELAAYVHPDIINKFCDAVYELEESK